MFYGLLPGIGALGVLSWMKSGFCILRVFLRLFNQRREVELSRVGVGGCGAIMFLGYDECFSGSMYVRCYDRTMVLERPEKGAFLFW